jgi:hypothetical protein
MLVTGILLIPFDASGDEPPSLAAFTEGAVALDQGGPSRVREKSVTAGITVSCDRGRDQIALTAARRDD